MIKNISPYGDQAIILDFGKEIKKEINLNVMHCFKTIQKIVEKQKIDGVENIVPSYNKLVIQFDLNRLNFNKVLKIVEDIKFENIKFEIQPNQIEIPVCYDEEFGIDLERLKNITGYSKEKIIEMHHQTKFYVYMLGFMPGFPYMGDLPKQIYSKRHATPRIQIAEGSVIIVEQFCAIYPYQSPGGWNIIGRTPLKLFNQNSNKPNLISPGDEIIFKPIQKEKFFKLKKDLDNE